MMRTMCPSVYHHSYFVATHALWHMIHGMYTDDPHYILEPAGKVIYIYIFVQKFFSILHEKNIAMKEF